MYILVLVISFLLHNNLIHKVWVDLINERQQNIHGFLGKNKQIPWNKPISGAMSPSRKLQLVESN